MRKRWPGGCPFWLNGEVDKAAHPKLMELGADGFKPDLLVHRPGDMGGNHAVLEVKPARSARQGAPKDLNTLSVFRRVVGYERAIYLIYGGDISGKLVEHIEHHAERSDMPLPVELWVHTAPGQAAVHVKTLQSSAAAR
ncbi:hypothetical protein C2U70_08770 [Bradyrhizobium guangdongense]|nr:hypothetical protein C2U70_08770 [Bradyrhizobium guangdongense]